MQDLIEIRGLAFRVSLEHDDKEIARKIGRRKFVTERQRVRA